MLRLGKLAVALSLGAASVFAGTPPAFPTAVFTLDAEHVVLRQQPGDPLAVQLTNWARSCGIEPSGNVYVLDCPPLLSGMPQKVAEEAGAESPDHVQAAVLLFRDLDETLYLAGCPGLEENSKQDAAAPSRKLGPESSEKGPGADSQDLQPEAVRRCVEVSAGRTFSAEVEGRILTIVMRGRQVPLTIFEVRSKEQTIDTPYELPPSGALPATGPLPSTPPAKGMPPQTKPSWSPPPLADLSSGAPSRGAPADVPPARTSLPSGRFAIYCTSSQQQVYLDGEYVGVCPIEMPLVAGRHAVMLRRVGQKDWVREFQIEAGESLRLNAP